MGCIALDNQLYIIDTVTVTATTMRLRPRFVLNCVFIMSEASYAEPYEKKITKA